MTRRKQRNCLLTCAFLAGVDVLRQVHGGETSLADNFTKYIISVRTFRRLALAVMVYLLLDHTVAVYFLLLLCAVKVGQLGGAVMIRLTLLPVWRVFLQGRVCNNTRRSHCHAHVMLLRWWQCGVNSLQQKKNKHETIRLHTTVGVQSTAKEMMPATVAHALNIRWEGREDEFLHVLDSIQTVHSLASRYANAGRTVCNSRTFCRSHQYQYNTHTQ